MNAALCAAFLEEDVWEGRLLAAASPQSLDVTECNSAKALLKILELKPFSLLIVVLNGVAGLEAVRQLRAKAPDVPLLWISDEDYSLFGYQYHGKSMRSAAVRIPLIPRTRARYFSMSRFCRRVIPLRTA